MKSRIPHYRLILLSVVLFAAAGCGSSQTFCFWWYGTWECDPVYRNQCGCTRHSTKSAAAATGDALVVSAAAHATGAQGTNWRSDLEVHNLNNEPAVFRIDLLEHGMDNSSPHQIELSLDAGKSMRLGDVLQEGFETDGIAALALFPSSGRIIVTSRTYNLLGADNGLGLPPGSTFGQFVPALRPKNAIRDGDQGRLIQLSHSTATDGGARTNLGLVNMGGTEVRVRIQLHTADGELLGTVNRNLLPYEYEQINRVFERATSDDVVDGYAVLTTSTPGGAFFAYASVVDNLTGDPVAITAERLPGEAPERPGDPVYVVAAAHVAGAAGTNWRTDLEVHCWSDGPAEYLIELLEHGANNSDPRSEAFTLPAGESRRFQDILDTVFAFDGAAALRITPTTGSVLVTSRTYNLLGEGNDLGLPAGATFGQFIPGTTTNEAIGFGAEGRLIQLSHSTDDGSGFRTNLVLVNATATPIDTVIDLFSADGTFLGTIDRSLRPYEYRQLNRVFASVTSGSVDDGYAVVHTTTEGGAFFALASVVDNLTGDPVGMGAPVILSEGSSEVLDEVNGVFELLGQIGIEFFVDQAQDLDVDGMLDILVDAWGDVASRTADGMVMVFGDGWMAPDGSVHEGSVTVNTSGITVGSSGINGAMTITYDGYLVDGEASVIGPTEWTFDLTERANGTVAGDITVGPVGKSVGSLSGTIEIDTEICLEYPISGSLSFELEGEIITITFGPDCEGAIEHGIEPLPIFNYSYGDPSAPGADDFIVSVDNAMVVTEGPVTYWQPELGGLTFEETDPGLITYHFPFDSPVVSGQLYVQIATFHFWYSRGHAFIYGSTDGTNWQSLAELPPPEQDMGHGNVVQGDLPAFFIGATDIWFQIRLYCYGSEAPNGVCNTAQHSRWDSNAGGNVFNLEVLLE